MTVLSLPLSKNVPCQIYANMQSWPISAYFCRILRNNMVRIFWKKCPRFSDIPICHYYKHSVTASWIKPRHRVATPDYLGRNYERFEQVAEQVVSYNYISVSESCCTVEFITRCCIRSQTETYIVQPEPVSSRKHEASLIHDVQMPPCPAPDRQTDNVNETAAPCHVECTVHSQMPPVTCTWRRGSHPHLVPSDTVDQSSQSSTQSFACWWLDTAHDYQSTTAGS